jgi:hypothetical protein
MDDRPSEDFATWHSEIASAVSYDDMVTKVSPLSRSVELLIEPSVESKRCLTYLPPKRQILETVLERAVLKQL